MRVLSKTRLFVDGLRGSSTNRSLFLNEAGGISAKWQNLVLSSVFQPIYRSTDLTKPVAYEAFVRCSDAYGNQIKPRDLFSKLVEHDDITSLDRLCRTIHLLNFSLQGIDNALLFLNVHEGLISAVDDNHGSSFRKVIDALGFSPSRIVIELPISLVKDKKRLHFVLQNYRLNSLEVAINIDSIEDIDASLDRAEIKYIKIADQFISSDLNQKLEQLATVQNGANIVITKINDHKKTNKEDNLLVQGEAYGAPSSLIKPEEPLLRSATPYSASAQQIPCLHIGG